VNPSPYLTITEAAEFLRRDPSTITKKIAAGVFVEGVHFFKRPGERPLFKKEALIEWVEKKDAKSPTLIQLPRGRRVGV
jgi:excisionase family DNA binding protein